MKKVLKPISSIDFKIKEILEKFHCVIASGVNLDSIITILKQQLNELNKRSDDLDKERAEMLKNKSKVTSKAKKQFKLNLNRCMDDFGLYHGIKPLHITESLVKDYLSQGKLKGAAGYPFVGSMKKNYKDALNLAKRFSNGKIKFAEVMSHHYTTAFYRRQPRSKPFARPKFKLKERHIYGVPAIIKMLELQFYIPLSHIMQKSQYYSTADDDVNLMANIKMKSFLPFLSTIDFKDFDLTNRHALLSIMFDEVRKRFKMSSKQQKCWLMIKKYYLNCKIFIGGEMITKRDGLLSGGMHTSPFGTLMSRTIIMSCSDLSHDDHIFACGDDNLILHSKPIDPTLMVNSVDADFKMKIEFENINSPPTGDFIYLGFVRNIVTAERRLPNEAVFAKMFFNENYLPLSKEERVKQKLRSISMTVTNSLFSEIKSEIYSRFFTSEEIMNKNITKFL